MKRHLRWLPALMWLVACPRPEGATQAPTGGWSEGWQSIDETPCYYPPNFAAMESPQERRAARSRALTEATRRWRGKVDNRLVLPSELVENLETSLMTYPERMEVLLPEDFQQCLQLARGSLSRGEYQAWLQRRMEELGSGDCQHPPFELISQFVDVSVRWQVEVPLCQGEPISIRVSDGQYTIHLTERPEDTRYLTAAGDAERPASAEGLPCRVAGCFEGQLIGRFSARNGTETVFPVGRGLSYVAPAHGTLTFGINDEALYDNRFRIVDGVSDYLLVEITPAGGSRN